ncbi:M16 family metallopeptidase [Paracoccus spongiarum]|uniref:Pitrilysin family protein n=1 Tax=Paracoccus spongiarum TaxID=3064387 RepID=A0ABT9JAL0_9RHOB|nr:pitrilysin family protein [Paracoccus sp. 2205BS29-5]MDP5306709.1 pitrilysin family protein [Paracoccus sp. 2205BS29-5]
MRRTAPPFRPALIAAPALVLLLATAAPAQTPETAPPAAETRTSDAQAPDTQASRAQPSAARTGDLPEGISHFTLPNGLEAVVIEDRRAPVVVQMLWYRVGAADEMPGKSGIAHYLEHLMFKGTDTLAAGEFSKTVTANGGMDNAFTSYDYTAYFQRIASDRLPMIMRMEADRMANLRIGEDDWQAERQVVLEERAQRTDSDPRALFAEERAAVQFYNHPYGRPVIGWRDEMMGLTREDAIAWYDAHYSPDEAVLIIAGDVTADEVRKLAEQYYGPIPAKGKAAPRQRPQEPVQRSPRRMQMQDARVAQPTLVRSYLAPERNPGDQQDAAALTVLAELLGGSMQTSVLGRALALPGKALWVSASYDGLSLDPTTFTLSMVPAEGMATRKAEELLDATLAEFLAKGPDEDDLARVKTRIRAAQVYARDSAHGRAYDYGQGLSIGLSAEDVAGWPDLLDAVTADQLRSAAAALLDSRATVTGWLLPAAATEAQADPQADPQAGAAATAAGRPPARRLPDASPATEPQQ